ncbi:helix-turn-helix domain-containing protein [Lacticaseibacillus saniviri]|uniref:Xre-like DNA-binding protein n=1 Tax=Lacticaseibacillus saniviri JCM 17471 = DSM 24301 TaxID=1293598 RepID=A0A0R2MT88_9LACO|nr:RodZ domain-containing protein [Lacticaseibacillus saniviri]KRO16772.1 Xre-like DNA-binding protein [Lacticaseibacillus saniviri JCM 17471 = DSM 24301]MCG4281754.1 DUF4115 domain-containing protein [Lacticaseibacillus saniviri]
MDEIGQKLREARTEKGYTIDDLQQITKIQKRYLIAIEEGRFDALPGDFYVRAFIKQYAQTVGLDGDALLNEFQEDVPAPQQQPEATEQPAEKSYSRLSRSGDAAKPSFFKRYLPQIVIALIALLIIAGVYVITIRQSQSNNKPAIPVDSSSVSIKQSESSSSKKTSSASSKKTESKSSSSSDKADKNKLSVKAAAATGATQAVTVTNLPKTGNKLTLSTTSATAWISVIVNGTTTWQGSVSESAPQTVAIADGVTSFEVKSGNAPVTSIKLNDANVDLQGGDSIVRTITFTATAAN